MTILPHALGGAVFATFSGNYFTAFVLGIISHFILDALPHIEPRSLARKKPDGTKVWSVWLYVFVLAEFSLTCLFFWFIRYRPDFYILVAGALGGIFPDIIVNNPFLQFLRHKPGFRHLFRFHDKIHLDLPQKYWFVGLIAEGGLIGGSIWYLLRS